MARLQTIEIAPGLVRDDSPSAAGAQWTDASLVRFDEGKAETIGGWESLITSTLSGTCRSLTSWRDDASIRYLACGQHDRLNVIVGGSVYDITPSSGFTAGEVDGLLGAGFGTGGYGSGGFGSSGAITTDLFPMTWCLSQWGQDLLANPRGQGLFQWSRDYTTPTVAAAVSGAPTQIDFSFVTHDRFVVLLGTTEEVSTNYNPMLVRWCDQEDNTTWTTAATGEAGEIGLEVGSRLVGGLAGREENLIWSDEALYAMRPTLDDLIWSFPLIGRDCGLIGPQAMAFYGGRVYWMGQRNFFMYEGGEPRPIPCRIDQDIFGNLAPGQQDKVICGVNAKFREIWWIYPDERDGNENSRYAILNVETGIWSGGQLERTAWHMSRAWGGPVAATAAGNVYLHESGNSADGAAMGSFAETGFVQIEDGDSFIYFNGAMPDFERQNGSMQITFYTCEEPRGPETTHGPYALAKDATRIWFEACGRFIRWRLDGVGSPDDWRLGRMRFEVQPTGMRM